MIDNYTPATQTCYSGRSRRNSKHMAAIWNALSDVLKHTQGGVAFRVALRQHVLESQKNYQTSCKTASSVVSYATFNLYFKAKSCTAIHMHECCQPCWRLLKRAIDKNDQLWQHWSCSLLDQLMEWLLGYTCTGNCSQEHDQTT